jgi:hypothetical protein
MRALLLLACAITAPFAGGCHLGLAMLIAGGATAKGPYQAEALAAELGPGSVRTIGCLDVGLVVHERDGSELLDLHVGNRCIHPEELDVARLAMRGVDAQGNARAVVLSDPRKEIARLHVGGAEKGRERLRLEGADGVERLCFDLEAIAPDAPAARPAPLCFERRADGWRPTERGHA